MSILSTAIIVFVILELSNVIIMYFNPEFKYGNSIAVFKGWEKSKEDEDLHEFVKYLVNWVAGTKLIFIVLLLVIVFTGNELTKFLSAVALVLSIGSYYFRLAPIIKKLDKKGEITPKGYSKTLGQMISSFMIVISIALILEMIL